ncbi:MAG: cation diffusion facilitator family transporter [Bacillota bacterium]|nr:cation diffusion facilitator family transporter [Bacillota bacterium]
MDLLSREKQITQTSIIGIMANLILVALKSFIGILSGSISIVLDAINNLTDALSSIITIIGIKLAKKEPDSKHPYGYGRIEYFSAIIIAGIVLSAGVSSLIESIKNIFHPEMPDYNFVTVLVILITIGIKIVLGKYVTNQGKKLNSDALVASGNDASFDAILTGSTLIGACITMVFHFSIDGFIGTFISAFIIKAGLEMLMESLSDVIGSRPDSAITKDIKQSIREIPGVMGAYDLVLHNYGPDQAIGSVHIELDAKMSAVDIHKLIKKIQLTILEEYNVFLTIGIYAIDEEHNPQRENIRNQLMKYDGTLGVHAIFFDEDQKYISMDVLLDFSVKNKEELNQNMVKQVQSIYPGFRIDINFDTNYSG